MDIVSKKGIGFDLAFSNAIKHIGYGQDGKTIKAQTAGSYFTRDGRLNHSRYPSRPSGARTILIESRRQLDGNTTTHGDGTGCCSRRTS